jgi:SAM-dependent methyltransferase
MSESKEIYNSSIPATEDVAKFYHKSKYGFSRYLAYREVRRFFKKYVDGNDVLDYGSGTGISIEFLQNQGFYTSGVDINPNMLNTAKANLKGVNLELIQPYTLFAENKYDLIFSSFVLEEIPTIDKIILYFKAANIALKDTGVLIVVTGNTAITRNDFLTRIIKPCPLLLNSGDMYKMYVHEFNIEFNDYYWTVDDFKLALAEANFDVKEIHFPLGKKEDNIPWVGELYESPYVNLVASVRR